MLSSVWGGRFMPILDRNGPIEEIRRQGRVFDVDALYAEDADGALGDLIREPGWFWQGRGEWGPFVQHTRMGRGLLPVAALLEPGADFVQPQWDVSDSNDLVFAAIWGLTDRFDAVLSPTYDGHGPRSVPLAYAVAEPPVRGRTVGAADLTGLFVRAKTRRYLDSFRGFALLRSDVVDDVVGYWNARTFGTDLIGLPADGPAEVVREMVRRAMHVLVRSADEEAREHPTEVAGWGFEHASPEVRAVLDGVVGEFGLSVADAESDFLSPRWIFQGLETPFTKTVRIEFRPSEGWVDVPVASLPLVDDSDSYSIGVVAAQVEMHRVEGQDPRFTASVPPYPRHSELLKSAMARSHVDHARVSSDGQVFGIDAQRQDAPYAFAYNLTVFEKLFDEESVTVSQSEVGRFQTRAAEKFGGAFSGFFNHSGVRSAVLLASGGRDGVALPHLRQVVERDRGDWPGPFVRTSPKEYAEQRVNLLLHSGLLVPVLRVHCSHCRVERWTSADDLGSTMTCEFCGEAFPLALSHGLLPPKWHYRLAGHLPSSQVQALLPALASASVVGQFRHVEEPPLAHVLGLEINVEDRTIEVDVAIYIPDHDWLMVVGEVKGANRIDAKDVDNLDYVAARLAAKDVRCVSMFATMKDRFGADEVALLRARVERSAWGNTSRGSSMLPDMPLVLTGPDLSHSPDSADHP